MNTPTVTVTSPYTGVTSWTVLYGYTRPCGRNILALIETAEVATKDVTDWFNVSLGELPTEDTIHIDAGPRPLLHERMLAAAPGEVVKYKGRLTKMTDTELGALSNRTLVAATMPPPRVLRDFGEIVPGPVHECSRCYWK